MNKLHLTGAYLRAFRKYAGEGGHVQIWDIMRYAADIVDIAAREQSGSLNLLDFAYSIGITGIIYNEQVDMLRPNEYGTIMVFPDEHKTYIVIDEKRSRQERRFTLAHEIGHYMLHIRDNGRDFCTETGEQREIEADLFAGALIHFIDQRI